jgi:ATP-binding cassette subfamily F protein 3
MIALSVSDVGLSFGTDVILEGVSFSVNDGDKVGVVGVNGAGKTSLFKIIAGIYEADTGAVYIQKGHTVGLLEQNPDLSALPGEASVLE